ncbi:LIM-domain binding protein-domain-containing protein [Stachybotrys elegans]|uniref:LIM-domain binding protein-domain-containing protein n=1 Tax=Stachybotrys elegans TaxID=80388 RepID=A0A8K0SLW3_9HYPO|nr:LIM-domain binding protein-domain-containing protein [Stachybotrys elegans]
MGHPGVAGHPMGPGMPPNPGQQGAPGGGMPHQFAGGHMGVPGPGGQLNPAMMAGLPPGAHPNAHMQHMSPAQQQMFQQQHMQGFNNSAAAMRQQQLMAQHQQRQAMMAQQAMQAGLSNMNGPMGMQLNPQQIQQLRQAQAARSMGPGQHQQAQAALLAQQMAMQQAQQQAQQHAQQQQQAQQQQAQQAQQAQQQQANHNQQMGPGHNPAQNMGMNPQNMPGPGTTAAAATTGTASAADDPAAFSGGHASTLGTADAGLDTCSRTSPAQPDAAEPEPTPQPQMGQVMPQQMGAQHLALQMQQQAQQQQAQQAQQQQAQQQQQQRREGMKSPSLLKLLQFAESLSNYPGAKTKDDLSYWNLFVNRFFSPNGVFRHTLYVSDAKDNTGNTKQYEIAYPAIARYLHTHFSSGVKSMQLVLDKGLIDKALPGEYHLIEYSRATMLYWYETGSHVVANGTVRATFDSEQRMELFEFITTEHEEYVARRQVIEAAKPAHLWMKEWKQANSQDGKQSPEMSKKGKRNVKSPQSQPPQVLSDLPEAAVNKEGVTASVHQFLEIVEVMGQMNPLFNFYHSTQGVGPYQAMEQYVSTYINNMPSGMNGQAVPQGPRTPSMGQFPMGASPAAVHMNLPGSGSPHFGSPAPGQLQAPGMQMQQSQQGTSSSGPSANTSPASNKRRRPSGVKTEDDGSGAPTPAGQVNGIQRKNPPTPRMTKKMKGNPS